MTSSAIDMAVFSELQDTAGADFVAELVGTFVEEAPQLLAALEAALQRQDADAFRRAAHSLKSNSQTFGAAALGERARALELGGLAAGAGPELAALREAYAQAAAALQTLCHG